MFYELYEWDFDFMEKRLRLINLSDVRDICRCLKVSEGKTESGGKYKVYHLKIYFRSDGSVWVYNYMSEAERNTVYNDIKQALIKNKMLLENPVESPIKIEPLDTESPRDTLEDKNKTLNDFFKDQKEEIKIPKIWY